MNIVELLLNNGFKQTTSNVFVRANKKVKFFMLSNEGVYQMMAVSSTDRSFPKVEYEIPETEKDFMQCVDNTDFHVNTDFEVRAKLLSKDQEIYVELSDKNGTAAIIPVRQRKGCFDNIMPQQYFVMKFKLSSLFIRNKYIPIIEVTDVIADRL